MWLGPSVLQVLVEREAQSACSVLYIAAWETMRCKEPGIVSLGGGAVVWPGGWVMQSNIKNRVEAMEVCMRKARDVFA